MARSLRKFVELTKCEAEVMDVVWEMQCVTVNDVVDHLDRDLAYTTVMTTDENPGREEYRSSRRKNRSRVHLHCQSFARASPREHAEIAHRPTVRRIVPFLGAQLDSIGCCHRRRHRSDEESGRQVGAVLMNFLLAFEVGVTLCLQISLVVAVTMALARWLGEARGNCRLWTICFVAILGLIAAAILLPHRRLFAFPISLTPETMLRTLKWQTWIACGLASIWTVGIVVSLARRGTGCWQLVRFLNQRCHVLPEQQLNSLPLDLEGKDKHFIQGDRRLASLQLMVSDEIQGPFCWQLHRPIIVLPLYLMEASESTLRHVLIHELEHLRTKHPMQHFLQGVCSTLLWFHPAVWLAADRAELTREFLCDEVAARAGGKFSTYLRTLVQIAERCGSASCTDVPRGTLAFGNRKSTLIRRSDRLVKIAQRRPPTTRYRTTVAFTFLVLFAMLVNQAWLPTNVMASTRSHWSPWPTWTAKALHTFNVSVRDFEFFDGRKEIHDLLEGEYD